MNRTLESTVVFLSRLRDFSLVERRETRFGLEVILVLFFSCLFNLLCSAQEITKEYYASGELKATGKIVNELKEGEWIFYYPSGKKNSNENYKEGALHGAVT